MLNIDSTSPQETTDSNSTLDAPITTPNRSPFKLFLTFIILILLGGAVYFRETLATLISGNIPLSTIEKSATDAITTSLSDEIQNTAPSQATFSTVSEAGPKAYPVINNDKLIWVPIDNPEKINTSYTATTNCCGGASGFGSTGPVVAPDLKKAGVTSPDHILQIVSSDGSVVVPDKNFTVDYFSGWSPDSQKLVVYSNIPSIRDTILPEGPGSQTDPLSETHSLSNVSQTSGFYLVDLQKKTIQFLGVMEDANFIAWVNNTTFLLSVQDVFEKKDKYMTFNIATLVADPTKLGNMFDPYFSPQFSFSADGSVWATTLAPHSESDELATAEIVVGPFPTLPTNSVIKGEFAMNQGPVVSPDGKKLMYVGYEILNGPNYVHLYQDAKQEKVLTGVPIMWIDNSKFLYNIFPDDYIGATNPGLAQTLNRYDITTKESKQLYQYKPEGN